jgi:hypothetical protein
MSNSPFILNQRIANLYSKVNGGLPTSSTLSDVLANGNSAGGQSITGVDNINLTTINGSAYPPSGSTPTLSNVLTSGNNATGQSIIGVDNLTATKFIGDLSGNAVSATTATNALQVSTSTTNTNTSYYLPMVSSYASSTNQTLYTDVAGHINYNPSTNQLNTSGTITNNGMTMNGSASQFLINNNSAVTPAISAPNAQLISFPSAKVTATKFIGDLSGNAITATTATNVAITSDNTAGTYYIPFTKTSGTGNKTLFIDDVTTPLTFNPNTGVLTSNSFFGSLTGNATSATNATNATNATSATQSAQIATTGISSGTSYYLPIVSSNASSSGQVLYTDTGAGHINYNPSTGALTNTSFVGSLTGNADTATSVGVGVNSTNATFYIPFTSTNTNGFKALQTNNLQYNPSTNVLTTTLNGSATSATTATNVTTTSDNTSGTYYIPFSKTTAGTSTALYLDDTTTPLTYNPSTSTLSATIFSTATAPVSGSQLGNKTYIDNFGGCAGWYYTASVNNGGASSATFAFPNCFSNNLNNAYDVYFVFNFSAPTSGYLSCNMAFTGISVPTYNNWTTSTSNSTTPTITNAFTSANAYLTLLSSMDTTTAYNLRSATPKISLWGCVSSSGGAGISQLQFSGENYGLANPGITGIYKTFGYIQASTGYITGTTLTFSSAMTGTATIIVKGRA